MKIFKTTLSLFSHFRRDSSGAAVIEFALIFPILTFIFFGTVELANFVYAGQKLQSASDNIVNIVNLQDDISNEAQLESIASILPSIVRPLIINDDEFSVIITVIQRNIGEDFAHVAIQPTFGGGPTVSDFSFNAAGDTEANEASLADLNFTFEEGDQVIIVESYMRYESILSNSLSSEIFGLQNGFMYHRTPPTQPRIRRFEFGAGSDV